MIKGNRMLIKGRYFISKKIRMKHIYTYIACGLLVLGITAVILALCGVFRPASSNVMAVNLSAPSPSVFVSAPLVVSSYSPEASPDASSVATESPLLSPSPSPSPSPKATTAPKPARKSNIIFASVR